jgi:exopolysaccharide production protein ExoY
MPMEQRVASLPAVRQKISSQAWNWRVVGACERMVALLLLVLAAPAVLVSAILIRGLSRQAPFIAHRRVGWRGSILWMLKLRTMWNPPAPAPGRHGWIEFIADDAGPTHKRSSDDRVPHAFARFCRRHSIDELPQLWHVVRGEMLLVGPRPITRGELREYYGAAADEILEIKPGIAGLWQTSGRSRLSYRDRIRLDLEFVRRRSASMYLRILLRTIGEVWTGANAW